MNCCAIFCLYPHAQNAVDFKQEGHVESGRCWNRHSWNITCHYSSLNLFRTNVRGMSLPTFPFSFSVFWNPQQQTFYQIFLCTSRSVKKCCARGLAVVKRMTEILGATVTLESKEGKGTKFVVRLPTAKNNWNCFFSILDKTFVASIYRVLWQARAVFR